MNRYKNLILNTFILGIGTFSSKILVFLLLPIYTSYLSKSDYGVVDLIVQTSNLLIPVVSLGITNGVIRFGLDSSYRKKDVFTTGLVSVLGGFLIFLILATILSKIINFSAYIKLIYLYVFFSNLRSLCSQFVRAKNLIRLYSFDGVLSTFTTALFTILFIVKFKMGVYGYIYAIILSDFLSALFLFFSVKLYKYINFNFHNKAIVKNILKYTIPLIPTTILWWVTNVSARYFISYMLGTEANGLYAISYKIPTLITLLSTIFIDAWQISAIKEKNKTERENFFTNVFKSYASLVFISGSFLILTIKIVTSALVSEAFYQSWQYAPFLILSTSFSCLVNFLGSIYFLEKKSNLSLITTLIGATVNISLNYLLIPRVGINGASFAAFISYMSVFIIRALNTRKFIKINWSTKKLAFNTIVLIVQSLVMLVEIEYWVTIEILIFVIVFLTNGGDLLVSVKRFLSR